MPGKGKKKYSKKQMKIARVAEPRDRITGADFAKLKKVERKDMAKLCAKGKAAAKRKFKVYPSAYANMYAAGVCSGRIKPKGTRKKRK
jgi:hypothetical protein